MSLFGDPAKDSMFLNILNEMNRNIQLIATKLENLENTNSGIREEISKLTNYQVLFIEEFKKLKK